MKKGMYQISDYSLTAVIIAVAAAFTVLIAVIPQLLIVAALVAAHLALVSSQEETAFTEIADIAVGFALLISIGVTLMGVL